MTALTTIGFDADDTLWHNERFFQLTQRRFVELLAEFAPADDIAANLLAAERRNLALYGYGVKGFTLSMIETAIELTDARVSAPVIAEVLAAGRDMLDHPVEPLPHAEEVLRHLTDDYRIVLITKGDLFHQERKLAQSGLGDYFDAVEIVSEKSPATYHTVFDRHGDGPVRAMMIGNSLKSDVVPAIQAGAWGVFVPHEFSWDLEHAEAPTAAPRYRAIADLGGLPDLVTELENR